MLFALPHFLPLASFSRLRRVQLWYKGVGGFLASTKLPGESPGILLTREERQQGRVLIAELSIFVDESGSQGGHSRYCLVSLVFHDQSLDISSDLERYQQRLAASHLPDYVFHASPLMNGKEPYDTMLLADRKRILSAFESLVRKLPFQYKVFAYRRSELDTTEAFMARFRRDLVVFFTDNLEFFQSYDQIKIYYDNGQQMVSTALHRAIEYVFSKQAAMFRSAPQRRYRLAQVADYLCTLELTAIKYKAHELTPTDAKIFGNDYQAFKRNHLKHVRRKQLS